MRRVNEQRQMEKNGWMREIKLWKLEWEKGRQKVGGEKKGIYEQIEKK